MNQEHSLIDGFGPIPVVRPETSAELGAIVRLASAEGTALYPVGGQTMVNFGNRPTSMGRVVDVRGLDQVIDFPARDMTITVGAGTTLARLRDLLASENLCLPVDVP